MLALFSEKIPKGQMLSVFLLNFPNECYEIKLAVTETRQKKIWGIDKNKASDPHLGEAGEGDGVEFIRLEESRPWFCVTRKEWVASTISLLQ